MHIIILLCRVFWYTLSQHYVGKVRGKVVKVEMPFLITPGRLRAVTGEILKAQRDGTVPSVDRLSCPSMEAITPKRELAEGKCWSAQPSILFQRLMC